ncbi:MAG TPA: hypothetical protein DHU55_10380, partial [Blastocatellia bacterium]|nr:hypothetical protein [Blastocatellia bacterium]
MVDIFVSILGSLALTQIYPNFNSLSVAPRHMKTPRWFSGTRLQSHLRIPTAVTLVAAAVVSAIASFNPDPPNTRLTNDNGANGGYVSDYTLVTGQPYTDDVLQACSQSRGRQNEPAVAVDPRNPQVIVGSSNDYCGV